MDKEINRHTIKDLETAYRKQVGGSIPAAPGRTCKVLTSFENNCAY